jgi:hypothetical protein
MYYVVQVPDGQTLQSGVYQLLQQGQLTPAHQDHPANRTCSRCSSSHSSRDSSSSSRRGQQISVQPQTAAQLQQQTAAQLASWQQDFAAQLWGGSADSSTEIDSVEASLDEDAAAAGSAAGAAGGSRRGGRGGSRGNGSSSSTLVDYSFHTSELQLSSSYHMAHGRWADAAVLQHAFSGAADQLPETLRFPIDIHSKNNHTRV